MRSGGALACALAFAMVLGAPVGGSLVPASDLGAARAEAPARSPRPATRPAQAAPGPGAAPARAAAVRTVREQVPGLSAVVRPAARPDRLERRAAAAASPAPRATAAAAVPTPETPTRASAASASARPAERPQGLLGLFRRAAQPAPSMRGSVCGNRAIRGRTVAPVAGRINGCGIAEPVQVTEVAGVKLSTPATIDCPTAQALHSWVEQGAKPAIGRTGGGLAALQVAAHYACRTRNNRPGARISEHGRGRAIDISALVLANGQRITVLHGWRSQANGRALRRMHAAACGPFGTVLGPNSDRFHQDHFHFDTARYRSGPYCR